MCALSAAPGDCRNQKPKTAEVADSHPSAALRGRLAHKKREKWAPRYGIPCQNIRPPLDIRRVYLPANSFHGSLNPAPFVIIPRDQKIQCWRLHHVSEKINFIVRDSVLRHLGGCANRRRRLSGWSRRCAGCWYWSSGIPERSANRKHRNAANG